MDDTDTDTDSDTDIDVRWYWDRRTNKAYYPTETDDDTVRFLTVWHTEEVADARDRGALVPVEEVALDRTETTFDLLDSFRLPDDVRDSTGSGNRTDGGDTGASGNRTDGGDTGANGGGNRTDSGDTGAGGDGGGAD